MWIPEKLKVMIERFPESRMRIIQLYNNDDNFKSLCDDYWLCTRLLEQNKNYAGGDCTLEHEYGSICTTLENDIHEYLRK